TSCSIRSSAASQSVRGSSQSSGGRSTPSRVLVQCRTASSPRAATSARMVATPSRVGASVVEGLGRKGSSRWNGGTAIWRIMRCPRGPGERTLVLRPMEPSESSIIALRLLAVLALVLLNAFFVAAEFALVGARRTRLEEMGQRGDRKAVLAQRAQKSLDRYISATQLGITLTSLGLGWIGEPALSGIIQGGLVWLPGNLEIIASHALAIALAFTIITVLHIILGELVPKALALLYPERVSTWVAGPLIGFAWVMALPIAMLNG